MNVRSILAGVVTVVVLAFVGGLVFVGRGQASPSLHLESGAAWFPTVRQGSIALIDGATGGRVTRIDGVAKPNGHYDVEQSGSSALIVDRDAGTVSKVDAATWQLGTPVPVGSPGDDKLAVHAGGPAAWVVSQSGTIVQQLDPKAMTLIGSPQTLPSAISGLAVAGDGRLWVTSQTGELRSYRDGLQVTSSPLPRSGATALVLVDQQPVVVDLATSRAQLIDADHGTPDRTTCLDAPVNPAPAIGGSSSDASWLLAVAPTAGTLVVSDVTVGTCQAIALGPTASTPRYGTPVEKDRFVFVPDFVAGQVIVVDPQAPPGTQIRARIDLGLPNAQVALLVHNQHVWFNDPAGDQAGVITDDFHALATSKADTGSSNGQTPAPTPTPTPTPDPAPPTADTSAAPGSINTPDPGSPAPPNPSSATPPGPGPVEAGIGPPGPELPAPKDNGKRGGDGAKTGGGAPTTAAPGGGGGANTPTTTAPAPTTTTTAPAVITPQFTIAPNPALAGDRVTFTDATIGTHTVVGWSAPDAVPPTSKAATFTATFARPGTFPITLTINTTAGAKSVTRSLTVNTVPRVPNLQGLTAAEALDALTNVGLKVGTKTATIDSVLPAGLITDSNPAAGSIVPAGTVVDYRDSKGVGIITSVAGPTMGNVNLPGRLSSDTQGNVYIASQGSNQIQKLTPAGVVSIIAGNGTAGAGGDGQLASSPAVQLNHPIATTVDAKGNIYIADEYNYKVRKIDALTGIITTVAGNGTGGYAAANAGDPKATNIWPTDLDVTPDGTLWISARWQKQILKLGPDGQLSIVPPGNGLQLTDPASIEFDANNVMYVAEPHAKHIVRLDGDHYTVIIGTGVEGFNGDGKPGTQTQVHDPDAIRFDGFGNLYFPDWGNNRIRRWSSTTDLVDTVAGSGTAGNSGDNGLATNAQLKIDDGCCSSGLVFAADGSLLISDMANNLVRKIWVKPPGP